MHCTIRTVWQPFYQYLIKDGIVGPFLHTGSLDNGTTMHLHHWLKVNTRQFAGFYHVNTDLQSWDKGEVEGRGKNRGEGRWKE